jgi:thiosulfate dehydrogenase (quinone) large subunit
MDPKAIISKMISDEPLLSPRWIKRFMIVLQAVFGLLWIEGSAWKVIVDGSFKLNYDGLQYWVTRGSEYPVIGAYKWLIDNFIVPNIKIFLVLVFVSELSIGLMFLLGKYVRLASLLAMSQTVAITLSVIKAPHEWKWSYFMMMMFSLLFFVKPTISSWPARIFSKTRY